MHYLVMMNGSVIMEIFVELFFLKHTVFLHIFKPQTNIKVGGVPQVLPGLRSYPVNLNRVIPA